MKQYIIAHDLGTTGNKATLYNKEGQLIGSAFYGYDVDYVHTGWAEQNPEAWWQAVCVSTHQLLAETKTRPDDIACISFSGQMMGCVPLDKNGRPLRSAIIWADQRAVAQAQWVGERVPPDEVYRITGHPLTASYSLNKILWLRDHQPDIYRAAHKFVHAKDAMVARLTGHFVTDHSDASGMNLYDLAQQTWSARIVDAAGLNADQLPEIHASTDVVGEVRPAVAADVGVVAGTPVVIGGGDGVCAAAGAGAVAAGVAYNYIGSSSWISVITEKPILDPDQVTNTFAHMVPGLFMPCGTMQAAGASYQWARDQLGQTETEAAAQLGLSPYELMNRVAQSSAPGANGLLFLPYLMGERSPHWNPKARAGFIGLTIRHTRADMIRAALEGITMNLRLILLGFLRQGASIDAMRVIGGGARGLFWNQMMADMYDRPVQRLAILGEATSMGAALAGGIGVGLYPDFAMSRTMNPIAQTVEPNPAAQAAYRQNYPIFEAAYKALLPIYDMLAEVG